MQVIKRDGRVIDYDENKVAGAIKKAFVSVGYNDKDQYKYLAEQVTNKLKSDLPDGENREYHIEYIQDLVEQVLIHNDLNEVAKEYILYRANRTRVREMNSTIMQQMQELTFGSSNDVEIKRENANINGDTAMGTMLRYGSEVAKAFNFDYLMSPDISKAHKQGDIHIHDADFYSLTQTCSQIDLDKLFSGGFHTGHGTLREPSEIRSYAALSCIALQSNQNEMHGGQSIPNFDYYLAPGVAKSYVKSILKILDIKYDLTDDDIKSKLKQYLKEHKLIINEQGKLFIGDLLSPYLDNKQIASLLEKAYEITESETYQAMEALVHNLNTMASRAGAQVPFSSINYGTDTSTEGRMVIKNVLLATQAGLGKGETSIFPV